MLYKISERDKKILMFGAVAMVLILGYVFVLPWFDDWTETRTMLKAKRSQLKLIVPGNDEVSRKAADQLAQLVPVFEMPLPASRQDPLFRGKFNEQVKKTGIKAKTLQPIGTRSGKRVSGYKTLKYQCRAKCNLNQILDLLANLNSNPYLAGIEEISFKCDQKNRQQMDLVLTVSTFAK